MIHTFDQPLVVLEFPFIETRRGVEFVIDEKTAQGVLYTEWKRLTWREMSSIQRRSLTQQKNGYVLDPITYRDLKLKTALKRWAIRGVADPTPVNAGSIDDLPAELAHLLLQGYEHNIEPSDNDLKELEKFAKAFFKGENTEGAEYLPFIYEHIIAKNYRWDLEKIRNLDNTDFQVHLRLCLVTEGLDAEFKIRLAGGDTSGKKKLPAKGSGPHKFTKKENIKLSKVLTEEDVL